MMIRKYLPPFVMWLVFEVIAVTLWFALDNIFFLFNFSYIGTAIAVGLVICPECSTICCWSVYDCVSGVSLSRKYADRGLLVLSFPRCI